MLETVKQKCQKAELDIADYVLFSRNGFIAEVEASKEAEYNTSVRGRFLFVVRWSE